MEVSKIIAEIDAQIAKLQQARELLSGGESLPSARRPGRPKGSKNATSTAAQAPPKKATSRNLSPEGRKRIAEAMKRRWAERKKAPAKTALAK